MERSGANVWSMEECVPELFGSGVHFYVQLFKTSQGLAAFVLMATDVYWRPRERDVIRRERVA